MGPDREWLQDVLLSDVDTDFEPSDEDEYVREMLRDHVKEKKIRNRYYRNPHVRLIFTIYWKDDREPASLHSREVEFGQSSLKKIYHAKINL